MTHEYVIAVGGRIQPRGAMSDGAESTAIAWAADAVLTVGPDDAVRSISRGDSTFLGLGGCIVTALPDDLAEAEKLVRDATEVVAADLDIGALLIDSGLLDSDSALEPGSPADLAFWRKATGRGGQDGAPRPRLLAVLRRGTFTDGDRRRGPFPAPGDP